MKRLLFVEREERWHKLQQSIACHPFDQTDDLGIKLEAIQFSPRPLLVSTMYELKRYVEDVRICDDILFTGPFRDWYQAFLDRICPNFFVCESDENDACLYTPKTRLSHHP